MGPDLNRPDPILLNDATTEALFARSHLAALRAIAARAIRADGIDRRALGDASLGEDRRHVGGEPTLESLRGHEHVVADAIFVKFRALDDQRLRIRALQLDRAGHEAFNRV